MLVGLMILGVLVTLSMNGGGIGLTAPGETDTPTEGDDSLTGGDGDDLIDGLAGDDTILGGEGDDTLLGGAGNDDLDGQGGINTLDGGLGDDRLRLHDGFEERLILDADGNRIGSERSLLDGGTGDETEGDLLDASTMTEALHLFDIAERGFIATSPRFERGADIAGFERYALGLGHDVAEIDRQDAAIVLDTGAGNDAVYLYGAAQGHRVSTGDGDDSVSIESLATPWAEGLSLDLGQGGEEDGDTLSISSDLAQNVVITTGGGGTATDAQGGVLSFAGVERFEILTPESQIDASGAAEDLVIAAGSNGSVVTSGAGNDTLGGDFLYGNAGDDVLFGNSLADGGSGDDYVSAELAFGGAGDDTLEGAEMTGGSGTDSFLSRALIGNGIDASFQPARITDYEAGETVALTVDYNSVDSGDPSITHPEPTVSIERIEGETTVTVLVDGQVALIIEGDSIPDDALTITLRGSDPWQA